MLRVLPHSTAPDPLPCAPNEHGRYSARDRGPQRAAGVPVGVPVGVPNIDVAAVTDLALVADARRALGHLRTALVGFLALGVLLTIAALFLPCFVPMRCRSIQSEAKGNLKALLVHEQSYYAEHDRYSVDFDALGFAPKGSTLRYRYVITQADRSFVAYAYRVDGELDDIWRVDDQSSPFPVFNGCSE